MDRYGQEGEIDNPGSSNSNDNTQLLPISILGGGGGGGEAKAKQQQQSNTNSNVSNVSDVLPAIETSAVTVSHVEQQLEARHQMESQVKRISEMYVNSEYVNTGICEYGNMGICEYVNTGICEYGNMGIWEYVKYEGVMKIGVMLDV